MGETNGAEKKKDTLETISKDTCSGPVRWLLSEGLLVFVFVSDDTERSGI